LVSRRGSKSRNRKNEGHRSTTKSLDGKSDRAKATDEAAGQGKEAAQNTKQTERREGNKSNWPTASGISPDWESKYGEPESSQETSKGNQKIHLPKIEKRAAVGSGGRDSVIVLAGSYKSRLVVME
jgi:hypothetical protein